MRQCYIRRDLVPGTKKTKSNLQVVVNDSLLQCCGRKATVIGETIDGILEVEIEGKGNFYITDDMATCYPAPPSWLTIGTVYYIPDFADATYATSFYYTGSDEDLLTISRGVVFKTAEEAINAAKDMLNMYKSYQKVIKNNG